MIVFWEVWSHFIARWVTGLHLIPKISLQEQIMACPAQAPQTFREIYLRCGNDDFTDDLLQLIHELCEIYRHLSGSGPKQQQRSKTAEKDLSKLLSRFSEADTETLQLLVLSKRLPLTLM